MTVRNLIHAFAVITACFAMPLAGYAQDRPRLDFAGSVTWIGQVPILVAIKKGFFKEQGIDVDVQVIVNSSDRIRALTAGDAAFSNLGRVAVISEMARGNESFSFFANVDDSPGQEGCWARPGITSVADLKGKAVAANSSAEITLAGLLADAGLKLGDLDYRNLPATEMAAALSHGDIEAACVWQPLLTRLKEAVPQGKLLGTDRETEMFRRFGTMAAGDIVIVSREVVEKYPNQARAIAAGLLKGADLTIENPQEAAAMVAEYFKQSPEEMLKAIQSFQYFGSKDWENHLKKHTEQMQYLADMLHEAGKIPERPDTAKWLDTSFVPKGN
ncbi:ABC transporter substrate-binding protein [Agrobacterium vitis]|uniref:ABC transporter substrate-binding protein n=1 Tax=Agrobacterium vitis TaxID=373 RepID=UPI00307D83A4